MDNSYYDILGVQRNDNNETIRKAWRKLCMKYHPDKMSREDRNVQLEADNKIKEINEAYEVLSDPQKRNHYDLYGKTNNGVSNTEDIINNLFANQRRQIQPIELRIKLSLEDLFFGKNIQKTIPRQSYCITCNRTGTKNGISSPCTSCSGTGRITKELRHGMFAQQQILPCSDCSGSGISKSVERCPQCNGNKTYIEQYILNQSINKQTIRENKVIVNNQGHEVQINSNEYRRGDIIIHIEELPHKIYTRDGNNLLMSLEITLSEALLGTHKVIKHLSGENLLLVEDSIIQPNDQRVFYNYGFLSTGDLIVTYKVLFPSHPLDDDQRIKLQEIFPLPPLSGSDMTNLVELRSVPFIPKSTDPDTDPQHDHPQASCTPQ